MDEKSYRAQVTENAVVATSQDILDQYGIVEYNVDDLVRDFEDAMAYKTDQARIFKVLDAADHSDIWKTYNKRIPSFVQTPTHNPITIIKEATKASIMPTVYAGEYRPMSLEAVDLAKRANKFFQMKWNAAQMDHINSDAADYAYLHGTSGVLLGWNQNIIDASDITSQFNPMSKSQIQAKAWHPANIFPDPTATTVDEMRYLYFAERKSKTFLKSIPRFANAMFAIEHASDLGNVDNNIIPDKEKQSDLEVVTFLTCYKRVLREVRQLDEMTGEEVSLGYRPEVDIIYMAGRNILDVAKGIQPSCIPFVPLYDEKVPNNFWGISKCYKVLSLVLALNQLDSTEATAYFKNQNPAEFINAMSGINVAEYQRKKDNPDSAFNVNCDPKLVQAYATRPELPRDVDTFRQYLLTSIQKVSGVDGAYLGQSYGSIQTTGGVNQAVDRATMRDNTRIKSIDAFIRKELELITQFYIMCSDKTENFYAPTDAARSGEASGEAMQFNPAELIGREDVEINVSGCAPRSNQSFEDAANKLFELQMKYSPAEKGYPDLLTPDELISWLNIPKSMQNVLRERMQMQMELMKEEEYTAVLTAVGQLTQGGMQPEMAVREVAKQIESGQLGQIPAANPNPGQPMPR